MVTEASDRYESDLPVPPGALLAEELETRGMSTLELAALTGLSPQAIGRIIAGRSPVTADTALELEQVLGVSATFWIRLEASYRLTLARRKRAARPA